MRYIIEVRQSRFPSRVKDPSLKRFFLQWNRFDMASIWNGADENGFAMVRSGETVLIGLSGIVVRIRSFDYDIRLLKIVGSMIARTMRRRQEYAEEMEMLSAENQSLRGELHSRILPDKIKGNSSKMNEVFALIEKGIFSKSKIL